jgi:hypothetical protein
MSKGRRFRSALARAATHELLRGSSEAYGLNGTVFDFAALQT